MSNQELTGIELSKQIINEISDDDFAQFQLDLRYTLLDQITELNKEKIFTESDYEYMNDIAGKINNELEKIDNFYVDKNHIWRKYYRQKYLKKNESEKLDNKESEKLDNKESEKLDNKKSKKLDEKSLLQPEYTNHELYLINQNIEKIFDRCTHVLIAELLQKVSCKYVHIKTTDVPEGNDIMTKIYIFNNETTLYEQIGRERLEVQLMPYIREQFTILLNRAIENLSNYLKCNAKPKEKEIDKMEIRIKQCNDILKNIENQNFMAHVIKHFINDKKLIIKNFDSIRDYNFDVANFTNGIVCLKTGEFRKRTPDDIYTETLNYEYHDEYNEEIYDKINTFMFNICNDDKKIVEVYKSWFGYGMTGMTSEQFAFWAIGHSATNGKSTIVEVFILMFHLYAMELPVDFYYKGKTNRHKILAKIKRTRFGHIEEFDVNQLNVQSYKLEVGGGRYF